MLLYSDYRETAPNQISEEKSNSYYLWRLGRLPNLREMPFYAQQIQQFIHIALSPEWQMDGESQCGRYHSQQVPVN